jgi:thioester reductase-like protein
MGQACGPKATGAWGTTEWMPIMVKSSVALGCLPDMTGVSHLCQFSASLVLKSSCQSVAWMPLDAIGQAYVDWVLSKDELPRLVNVVHPRPTTWDVILRGLRKELGESVPLVPLSRWVSKLEARSDSPTQDDLTAVVCLRVSFANIRA